MEYYRRVSSFFSNFLSIMNCKSKSVFKKYNEPNDVSLNMSVHKDIEEQNIEFNDNDEKLPSVIENNNNDEKLPSVIENNNNDEKLPSVIENNNNDEKLPSVIENNNNVNSVIDDIKMIINNDEDDSDDGFKEFEQFKKNDNNECGVVYNYDLQDKDIGSDITMITSNDKPINNIDDFNKNF
jgi:hypothetical protein